MSDISVLARIQSGLARNVDISANTLVVTSIKIGGLSNTELTKAILDRLVNLQNGSDVDATYHTHDGRYFTETELGSSTSSSGSDLIGDDNTYSNFTPSAATVKGALSGIDAALGTVATTDFADNVFRIHDDGDASKKIAFQASGIATATVRTITMPDANVNLADANNAILKDGSRTFTANQPMGGFKLTGLGAGSGAGDSVRYEQAILITGANAFTANQSLGSHKLTNVSDPTSAQDAATKAYVDNLADGRLWKQAVRVASTGNLNLASMPAAVDGVTLTSGDRFLAKDQTAPAENGIYVFNGASSAATRASDGDTAVELNGTALSALAEGTANKNTQWYESATIVTLGTDPVTWVYLGSNNIFGHDMISVTGTQISVDLAAASGLESSNPGNAAGQLRVKLEASNPSLKFTGSNELAAKLDAAGAIASGASGLAVQVDGSTIEISSDALRVKDAGITLAKLASNSVDENKIVSTALSSTGALTGGSGSKLAWNPDGSTLEINSNAARIKDAGVTAAKLNTNAFDQSTITGGGGSAAAVQYSPLMKRTLVAGEAFAANTSFLVRWAVNGETAARVYKADNDATSLDNFYVVGIALSTSSVSAGQNIAAISAGTHTLGSSDTPFSGTDIGKPVFLDASGAFTVTAPSAAFTAVVRVGMVQATNKIDVQIQVMGVN